MVVPYDFMLELLKLLILQSSIDQIVKNIGENRSNGTIALFWPVSGGHQFSECQFLPRVSTPKDQYSEGPVLQIADFFKWSHQIRRN